MSKRQNMNWPLAANFEATNVTFLPKKLASNVQSTCIDNSKRPKSELWHYCIKATKLLLLFYYFSKTFFFSGLVLQRHSGEAQHDLHPQQPRDPQVRDRQVGCPLQRIQTHRHGFQAQKWAICYCSFVLVLNIEVFQIKFS